MGQSASPVLSQKTGRPSGPSLPPPPVTKMPMPAPASMEEAWAQLNEANPGKDGAAIEKIWFDTIAKLFPNKSNTDLKPHEWGKLKAEFKDEIPM